MNEKWKVSIVTVAYNSEMTIGRIIESVLNQTYCLFNKTQCKCY